MQSDTNVLNSDKTDFSTNDASAFKSLNSAAAQRNCVVIGLVFASYFHLNVTARNVYRYFCQKETDRAGLLY